MLVIKNEANNCQSQLKFSSYLVPDILHLATAHGHYQVVVFAQILRKWYITPPRDVWTQFRSCLMNFHRRFPTE